MRTNGGWAGEWQKDWEGTSHYRHLKEIVTALSVTLFNVRVKVIPVFFRFPGE